MNTKELIRTNYQQILFVLIAFLAMVLVSYVYVSRTVSNQMLLIGEASMDTTQTAVSAGLTETELLFANVMQTVENMLSNKEPNAEILAFLRSTNAYFNATRSPLPDFMKIYAYIRGEFLDGSGWVPPPGYRPESRPWHIGAENSNGKIFFSEPYTDAETGGLCISFSQKLFDRAGAAYGILAVDLKLTRIADYVHRQHIVGNGYGVLIDDKLNFITHRDEHLVGVNMSKAGGDYPKLAQMFADGKPISAMDFTDTDKTDSVIFFRTVFNGWHIGTIIPRASYYQPVYGLALALGSLGFVLMLALSYMLVRTRVEKMRSEEESLSKSNFLARMSHEMRTPMNAIIGMTEIAKASLDPAKKEYCLGRISEASDHLLGVINDVLDMSKIEAGKLELSETDFPLAALLRQVETVIRHKIEEQGQNFKITVGGSVPTALIADRQRLAQVLANLLSNANKFTPKGGRNNLRIERLPEKQKNGCILQIEVADSGIGISKEQQAKLFRPFEQADGSISRKYGGTGLGLAISQKIIELMGGKIRIESEPGQGARFIFTIRTGIGGAKQDAAPKTEPALDGMRKNSTFAGKRILLVEDVEINREIIITMLEGTGIEIDSAENGRAACDAFAAAPEKYDLIFMDIHMPEMNGYEATKHIRGTTFPRAASIPIIAMTANVFREDIEKCLAVGMNDHIGKPLNTDELMVKLEKYLP